MLSRLILYLVIALIVYRTFAGKLGRTGSPEGDSRTRAVVALFWPVTLAPLLLYRFITGMTKGSKQAFGGDEAGAAAFIAGLERQPEAPLKEELTITYSPSGISKTYPAGTLFPSALLRDWKAGHFTARRGADE